MPTTDDKDDRKRVLLQIQEEKPLAAARRAAN